MLTIPSQLNYWCGLLHAAGDGTRAVLRAEPSGNRHREAPGGAAGHDDVDLVRRRELGDERVESELGLAAAVPQVRPLDRKSTRLNSSHGSNSYAVFF